MPFSFTRNLQGPDETGLLTARAQTDLDEAIAMATAWPELEDNLAAATRRMGQAMDDEAFAEQQRLLKMKTELTQRLSDLMQAGD